VDLRTDHYDEKSGMASPPTDFGNAIDPIAEVESYETLYGAPSVSLKRIAEYYARYPSLPSRLLEMVRSELLIGDFERLKKDVRSFLRDIFDRIRFSVSVNGSFRYPARLRCAKHPIELFYYRGDLGLLDSPSISVVGARKCTPEGERRAARLARELTSHGYTVVSGLAAGIDTAAMTSAIESGGRTVGVIGTPLNASYPKSNSALQELVAETFLLISQVPFYRYHTEPFQQRRFYFPQRNETMAALSHATVIVEASETSGSLTQARACLQQGRKLFILNSCFESGLTWPEYYARRGAIRVHSTDDILSHLPPTSDVVSAN
jgi:DNA processing protein